MILSKTLLEAAVAEIVKEEDQLSLSVGIIGAPNAGKYALTNFMVAAVSRKTNTTTHVLGADVGHFVHPLSYEGMLASVDMA
ncbi:GTP-binding protein ERG-like [Rutidosis leptorrhynchoides]|uniref:GTP-binding protein ERG-like n=1 Tax=Rutidosis leptorrhynchoides TaxID=125765 RepID=UPI003A99109A